MATLCVIAWKVTTELQPNADHVSTGIYSELKNEETFMERETALKRQKLSRAGKDQPILKLERQATLQLLQTSILIGLGTLLTAILQFPLELQHGKGVGRLCWRIRVAPRSSDEGSAQVSRLENSRYVQAHARAHVRTYANRNKFHDSISALCIAHALARLTLTRLLDPSVRMKPRIC